MTRSVVRIRKLSRRQRPGTPRGDRHPGSVATAARVLKVDGKEVASEKMEHTLSLLLRWDENFDTER
jgi:hypothetical protein